MNNGYEPPTLRGCDVLPAMEPPRSVATSTPRRKPAKCSAGRFKVLNTFIDFALRSLRRNEIAVWLVLYRDTKDGTARTSQSDIATRAGIARRTVVRSIKRLEERGLLRIVHRGGLSRGPSVYRVLPLETES